MAEILIGLIVYVIFGLIVFGLMMLLQEKYDIEFDIDEEVISDTLTATILAWPIILIFVFPLAYARHLLRKNGK